MRKSVLLLTSMALAMLVAAGVVWAQSEESIADTDTTRPTVTRTVPPPGLTCVDPTANVSAFFSEDMQASSVDDTTVKLYRKDSATLVATSVSYGSRMDRAIINPTDPLEGGVTSKQWSLPTSRIWRATGSIRTSPAPACSERRGSLPPAIRIRPSTASKL